MVETGVAELQAELLFGSRGADVLRSCRPDCSRNLFRRSEARRHVLLWFVGERGRGCAGNAKHQRDRCRFRETHVLLRGSIAGLRTGLLEVGTQSGMKRASTISAALSSLQTVKPRMRIHDFRGSAQ